MSIFDSVQTEVPADIFQASATSSGLGRNVQKVLDIPSAFPDYKFKSISVDTRMIKNSRTGKFQPSFSATLEFDHNGVAIPIQGNISSGEGKAEGVNSSAPLYKVLMSVWAQNGGHDESRDKDAQAKATLETFVNTIKKGVNGEPVMVGEIQDSEGEWTVKFWTGAESSSAKSTAKKLNPFI